MSYRPPRTCYTCGQLDSTPHNNQPTTLLQVHFLPGTQKVLIFPRQVSFLDNLKNRPASHKATKRHSDPFLTISTPLSTSTFPVPVLLISYSPTDKRPPGHQARDCQSAGTPLCYNCGESGHISRDCTGERKEKACYKCNEVGHISRDCPNATEGSGPECYKCGKPGHISRNCPEGYSSGGSRGGYAPSNNQPKTCYTCGGVGHMSRDCNQGSKCYNCGNTGHISRECPEERKEKACYKCNEVGHISRDCPQQA
ncbi:hypothetical protein BGX23_006860 [Mortierella sp. AD031]|nr:hypothetical protein BGX23_006860 [Mortierella sp. AD031]